MKLKCINNTDKTEFTLYVDDFKDSRTYWHFQIKVPEGYADGEYTFYLYDDDMENCYGQGIMQIGDYEINKTTYTKDENGYKQYNG